MNDVSRRPPASDSDWLPDQAAAVVKLFVTQQPWDPYQPWDREYAEEAIGSGFYYKGRIVTNAHVVADASFIELDIPGTRGKLEGRIAAVNHQVDLALVEPIDHEDAQIAGERMTRIQLGGALPAHMERVVTVGYPIGGREVSYTAGVVSRVDVIRYAHSNVKGLLVQTDAAINPGNSGGPVFAWRTRKCVGIATQGIDDGEGLGYFVPVPVLRQFLTDVKNPPMKGIGNLGCRLQALQNPAHRRALGITRANGVRIARVAKGSSADGVFQIGDVIMSIDGTRVSADGRVRFGPHGTVHLSYKLVGKQVGEAIPFEVLRDGKIVPVEMVLKPYVSSIIPDVPLYDVQPRYFVAAGFVFIAVDERYVTWLDNNEHVPDELSVYRGLRVGHDGLKELVVISRVLNATINKGYSGQVENSRVLTVNDRKISSLDAAQRAIDAAATKDAFIRIRLESGYEIVLESAVFHKEDAAIRRQYNLE